MEIKDIMKLVDAGFTKEDITALAAAGAGDKEIPAEADKTAAPEPEEKPEPEKTIQTGQDDKVPQDTQYNELLGAIERLTNTIIDRNINTSNIDAVPARTTDDMIASVLGLKTEPGGKRK